MVAPKTVCDSELLQRVVRGLASQVELDDLELHLGECMDCQQTLQTLSGGLEFAASARNMLPPREWQSRVERTNANSHALPFLVPSADSRYIGKLSCYHIESVLGQGGFGVVLKGFDPNLNRYVAIKVLASPLLHSAIAKQRFEREAKAAASVSHEAVVPIYAVESDGPVPYLVLAYVPGPSLDKYIDEHGPLEPLRVIRIAMQIADGLAAAHSQGIVHRDIKPGNILMTGELDRIKITDFGLARVVDDASQSQSGMILGTPQYMSPEQARGESVDQRSDLFSLGSVMYAMCCGHSPFRAETAFGVLRRISDDEPRNVREHNPAVPAELAGIIHRLLSKKAQDRFNSATELADLLRSYLAYAQQPLGTRVSSQTRRELKLLAQRGEATGSRWRFGLPKNPQRVLLVCLGLLAISAVLSRTLGLVGLSTSIPITFKSSDSLPAQNMTQSTSTQPPSKSLAWPNPTAPLTPSLAPSLLPSQSDWDTEYQAVLGDLDRLETHLKWTRAQSGVSLQSFLDEIHLSLENVESYGY